MFGPMCLAIISPTSSRHILKKDVLFTVHQATFCVHVPLTVSGGVLDEVILGRMIFWRFADIRSSTYTWCNPTNCTSCEFSIVKIKSIFDPSTK